MAEHWRLWGAKSNATVLNGLTEQDVQTGTEVRAEKTGADYAPRFISIVGHKPQATFSTRAISQALAIVGALGVSIADLAAGLTFYLAKITEAGNSPAAGSVHRSYALANGLFVPVSLSVDTEGDATLSCQAYGISADGTTNPLTIGENIALPAGMADNQRFALGPVTLLNQLYSGVRSVNVNFGLTVQTRMTDGAIVPQQAYIDAVAPTVTIVGDNAAWLGPAATQVTQTGRILTHADSEIYLRKRVYGGTFEADGSAVHAKISAAGMAVINDAGQASGSEPAQTTIAITPVFDGTNSPLLVTTNTAIS